MFRIVILMLCLAVMACSEDKLPQQPAPIGDKAVLEQLAAEYNKLAENVSVSPWRLPPSDRKAFLVKVFANSGYNYSATLHQLALGGWDSNDQNVNDLIKLIFMPHTDLRPHDGLKGVYSGQELADVRKIQKMLP